jgi:hypothetical protein
MYPTPRHDDEQYFFNQVLGHYDAPAFIRRIKRLEDAERMLHEQMTANRSELGSMVRLRIGQLRALAGEWASLRPLLADDASLAALTALHDELQPELRLALDATRSAHVLRGALTDLMYAIEIFNQRWRKHLLQFDLAPINELRDGYNRHYLIEKECALRNSRVARLGFHRREPLTTDELRRRYPLLPLPRLAE